MIRRKRVIACQGSLQLLTALSAVRAHEASTQARDFSWADHLVIFDVDPPFANFIRNLALKIHSWESILFLTSADLAALKTSGSSLGPLAAMDNPAELYVCRTWQPGNEILLSRFSRALRIEYGDGIGYFFGAGLFDPKPVIRARNRLVKALRHLIRIRNGPKTNIGYFLLPNIFRQIPQTAVRVPPRGFLDDVLNLAASALGPELNLSLNPGEKILIFLPGNFSPRWTSRENEIAAYLSRLEEIAPADTHLVIKPHPRSELATLNELRREIVKRYPRITFLEPPASYIPFELIAIRNKIESGRAQILSFTTAGIPLVYLYGLPCTFGFGPAIIERCFPAHAKHMIENEEILNHAISSLGDKNASL